MSTIQKLIAGICILSIPFFTACGKDDPATCNYLTEVQDEATTFSNAATLYYSDITNTANCQSYKVAYQNYLNALKDVDHCVKDEEEAAYHQALLDIQADIDLIQC